MATAKMKDGAKYCAKDAVTGDYYSGDVHPDVVASALADGKCLAAPRTITTDEFGTKATIWVVAPALDLPGPFPGEYRYLTVEEVK